MKILFETWVRNHEEEEFRRYGFRLSSMNLSLKVAERLLNKGIFQVEIRKYVFEV